MGVVKGLLKKLSMKTFKHFSPLFHLLIFLNREHLTVQLLIFICLSFRDQKGSIGYYIQDRTTLLSATHFFFLDVKATYIVIFCMWKNTLDFDCLVLLFHARITHFKITHFYNLIILNYSLRRKRFMQRCGGGDTGISRTSQWSVIIRISCCRLKVSGTKGKRKAVWGWV